MQGLSEYANKYYETGDLDCIDDFADALSQAVDDAEGDEDELQAVLSQLEDLVVEDIVRTSDLQVGDNDGSQPGPSSRNPAPEPFLQATTLILLPQLVRFPAFSSESASTVTKLLLLICQRCSPKELLLAIEQSLERLLHTQAYEDSGTTVDRLNLLLMALINVLPRVGTKKPVSMLKTLLQLHSHILSDLEVEPSLEAESSASLLLDSVARLIGIAAPLLAGPEESTEILLNLALSAVASQLATLPIPWQTTTQFEPVFRPPDCMSKLAAALAGSGMDPEVLIQSQAENSLGVSQPAFLALLATWSSAPYEEALRLTHGGKTDASPRGTAGRSYGLHILSKYIALHGPSAIVSEVDMRAILQYCRSCILTLPAAGLQAAIALSTDLVVRHCAGRPDLQTALMKDTLNRNDTRIRTVGIGMLRKLISESTASSTSLLARFWSELLPSESEIERLFTEDAAQTLCISVLNLVYLAVNSTAHEKDVPEDAIKSECVATELLRPMRAMLKDAQSAGPAASDVQRLMTAGILEDTLYRVESSLETLQATQP